MSLGGAYCHAAHPPLEAREGARGAQNGRALDVRARRRDALEAHLALLLLGALGDVRRDELPRVHWFFFRPGKEPREAA